MIPATPQYAAQCLQNEAQRDPRRGRPPGKASAKRRTPQARKVRERGSGHVQDPWNRDGEMRLFVCDSVRAMLPIVSKYR